jgi:hypothetical protein
MGGRLSFAQSPGDNLKNYVGDSYGMNSPRQSRLQDVMWPHGPLDKPTSISNAYPLTHAPMCGKALNVGEYVRGDIA